MNLAQMQNALHLTALTPFDAAREIAGGTVCDLLSWVMANGVHEGVWITVQTHVNVVAVASLLDMAAIIVPSSIAVEKETIERAAQENIAIFASDQPAFALAGQLYANGLH